MKVSKLIVIAAATAFAGALSAQTPPIGTPSTPPTPGSGGTLQGQGSASGGASFDQLDTNKDGNLSKKEVTSNRDLTKRWDTLDANKDGKLDQGEFAQFEVGASGSMSSGEASGSAGASGSGSTGGDRSTNKDKPKF